ncbi:ThiJ/PfpI family protein [methanotrophic endosymbiont of Bathymodiolus azoricus (Menez Gwen)]|jgi:putative intracellular protease/amidase|nr:ThiJ/PfpI family protein [methanotrophic endosymbiont of Bathymodiolus azoricus (Menez Gwen)]
MKILMVLTSHDQLGDTSQKTGFWLDEFASPYYVFKDALADITLASPLGGQSPIDPKSEAADFQTEATQRFNKDTAGLKLLANTLKLSDIVAEDYDALFYPGGHGPLWDLVDDADSIALIETMYASRKAVAAVCHAPSVLLKAKAVNGSSLVKGKSVTGFSNSEEEAVQLTDVVPFLLENELIAKGANYSNLNSYNKCITSESNG